MAVQSARTMPWIARWATYLRERYPPVPYAVALTLFCTTTLVVLRAARGREWLPDGYAWAAGSVNVFLLFLQLRVLDEFKDHAEDVRYRPELPVPRGLVTLRQLGRLWLLAVAVQLALAAALGLPSLLALAVVLSYSGLMRAEFFARDWLRARALAYLLSHMMIVPLAALWVAVGESTIVDLAVSRTALAPYLVFGYLNFCVFELGRKIRVPSREVAGVDTYSARWGYRRATLAWAATVWAAAAAGLVTAASLAVAGPFAGVAAPLAAIASAQAVRFVRKPQHVGEGVFASSGALWFIGAQAALIGALAFARA